MKKICFESISLAAFLTAFALTACGDDNSSSSADEGGASGGTASVESFEDLVHCTKSHYGEVVYVKDENTYFECTSEDWVEVDSATVDSILATSSSSADVDTVKSSSSVKADSSEIAKVETKKVDSVAVSGFAQKGPFASGSVVTVYGLDSVLNATKAKFSGKVSGDSGAFTVEKIVLPNQFALVEASGFYANENTGKKTSGTKTTLNAIVDLSAGKMVKANVNILTELEYARVKHLVTKEGFNVPAAKKRATKELLAAFDGKGSDDLTATSISLADTGSAGTTLLAASILLQGDLSASKFGLRLGDLDELFAATGALDNDSLRTNLADWASKTDSIDNFAAIRTNIKEMKFAATVPDFEKILYALWTAEYKLGACTDSLEETIKKNENKLSDSYGAGYACTAKRWHKATALDTDLGLCTGKMEGSFKEYKGGKSTEYYVCRTGTWQKITETQYELKECTEDRDNEYVKAKSGDYFVCAGKQWQGIDALTYELKLCTEKRNKELAKTEKSGSYVCEWDGKNGTWREATDIETELGVCVTAKADSIYKTKSNKYYACKNNSWKESTLFDFEIQALGACTESNKGEIKETASQGMFTCDNKSWRQSTEQELVMNKLGKCTTEMQDTILWTGAFIEGIGRRNIPDDNSDGKYYRCNKKSWEESDKRHFVFGATCQSSYSYRYLNDFWASDDGVMDNRRDNFIIERFFESASNWTDEEYNAYTSLFVVGNDTMDYAICNDDVWTKITVRDFNTRKICTESLAGKKMFSKLPQNGETNYSTGYVCVKQGDSYAWQNGLVDTRDTTIYRLVTINGATWMAENLNYRYIEKTIEGADYDTSSYCYENDVTNCEKYGRLYIWSAAMDSSATWTTNGKGCGYDGPNCSPIYPVRGICPEGSHLPDSTEWMNLYSFANSNEYKLRSSTHDWSDNGTDVYGFTAYPAGQKDSKKFNIVTFSNRGTEAHFWSSTARESFDYLSGTDFSLGTYNRFSDASATSGFSIRCVKDK